MKHTLGYCNVCKSVAPLAVSTDSESVCAYCTGEIIYDSDDHDARPHTVEELGDQFETLATMQDCEIITKNTIPVMKYTFTWKNGVVNAKMEEL